MNTPSARETVLGIKELRDHIFSYAGPGKNTSWLFVSKGYRDLFVASTSGNFEQFLVNYCDSKVISNPRWAYYAYKCSGTDSKYLRKYKIEAISDFPFEHTLAVIAVLLGENVTRNELSNIAFRVTDKISFALPTDKMFMLPSIITVIYFLCAHVLTLLALFMFNCCTNVKGLFRNMAIAMILLTLMIKITSVL